jgi:uncharacterized protein (DUF2141 family)
MRKTAAYALSLIAFISCTLEVSAETLYVRLRISQGKPKEKIITRENLIGIQQFILKQGKRQTYCNMYNNNPAYQMKNYQFFLNPDDGQGDINCDPKKCTFHTLVIRKAGRGRTQYRRIDFINKHCIDITANYPTDDLTVQQVRQFVNDAMVEIMAEIKKKQTDKPDAGDSKAVKPPDRQGAEKADADLTAFLRLLSEAKFIGIGTYAIDLDGGPPPGSSVRVESVLQGDVKEAKRFAERFVDRSIYMIPGARKAGAPSKWVSTGNKVIFFEADGWAGVVLKWTAAREKAVRLALKPAGGKADNSDAEDGKAEAKNDPQPAPVALDVTVQTKKPHTGVVRVALCQSPKAYDDKVVPARRAVVPLRKGRGTLAWKGLQPGRYAIKVFFDANGNGKLDKGFWGSPVEPYGFSNNARGKKEPPSWDEASFEAESGKSLSLTIDLH